MRFDTPRPTVAELQAEGVLLVEDGNHGEYRPRSDEFVSHGVAFIRAADMDGGRVLFDQAERINEVARARIRKGIGCPGDVLLSHKGTVGKVALASDNAPPYVCSPQTTFWRTLDANRLDRRYLYSYLRSPDFRAQLASRKGETDMADYVSLTAQRQLRVALPGISIQREIGSTVGALDARIDLLRQTNATLESIAQALFKSWFIDFDPVRAKAEGREPLGLDAATAALFPAEFEASALGVIPKGWRAGALQTICTNPRAQAKPGQMPSDTPYIGLEHMPRKSIALSDAGTAEGLESGKFWFERNDVLFGKLRPYFHKVGLAPGRGVCSTDILVLRPTSAEWLGFLAMHASSDALITHTTQLSNGARMPRTSWQDVGGFDVALPLPSIAAAFDGLVRPMFERIHANIDAARVLAGLRDTLLPRLISGKLRLPEAQEQLEDALT